MSFIKNVTIKFFLYDKVASKTQGYPIYSRITYNRKMARFATGEYCQPNQWDENTQRPIRNPRVKELLTFFENRAYEIKRKLDYEKKPITAKLIRDILTNRNSEDSPTSLLDYFDNYIARISLLKEDYTAGTVRHYKTTHLHLTNFLEKQSEKDISLKAFDLSQVKAFDEFLMTTPTAQYGKPMGRNTANKYHTKLKTVLLEALRDNLIAKNPYMDFTLREKKVKREFLTMEEIQAIQSLDFSDNKSLDRLRDVFLFSCYTGLRFGDAMRLSGEHIKKDSESNFWIELPAMQKTGDALSIPLISKAIDIYKKYDQLREITGHVLPQLSNQKTNAYLKVIADLAGISKKLTHHIARHTFATTIMLDNDVSLKEVSRFLGHTSIKSTEIYAKITRDKMLETKKLLDDKL